MVESDLSLSGFWGGRDRGFPDPWLDYASLTMPRTMSNALEFCQFALLSDPIYRQGLLRIISYFMTDVECVDPKAGKREKEHVREYFHDHLQIIPHVQRVAFDRKMYGNSFNSVLQGFKRYMVCPQCHRHEAPFREFARNPAYKFRVGKRCQLMGQCVRCGFQGAWKHDDRRSTRAEDVILRRWSPHELEIQFSPISERCAYIWKIPQYIRNDVLRGQQHVLEDTPWEIIEAVNDSGHFQFNDDVVLHLKEQAPAGLNGRLRGWGLPEVLVNYRQAFYVQLLRRTNEALSMDFVIPIRIVTPEARMGEATMADPATMMDLGTYRGQFDEMIQMSRLNPTAWHYLPFPVKYSTLGGDASKFVQPDLLAQAQETELNAIGVPVQFYKFDAGTQFTPQMLRMMEAHHIPFVSEINWYIDQIGRAISQLTGQRYLRLQLKPPRHADNIEEKAAKLQLWLAGKISAETALQTIDADPNRETIRMLEEEAFSSEAQEKMQQLLELRAAQRQLVPSQMQQMQMQMSGGGQPAQGGGMPISVGQPNMNTTVDDLYQQATAQAQQIYALPDSQRASALINLKKQNPPLHAMVSEQLEQMKQQDQLQGAEMAKQQRLGQQ